MRRLAIIVPVVKFTGDAVSNDVVGMHRTFSGSPRLHATLHTLEPSDHGEIPTRPYSDIASFSEHDIVVYHYCTADQAALDALQATKAQVVLKYHNVTPPRFFEGYSEVYVRASTEAIRMLADFVRTSTLCVADSEFNKKDLVNCGMASDKVTVIPPFHQTEKLLAARVEPRQESDRFEVLSVGRIVPNKKYEVLLESFHNASKRHRGSRVSLRIVGKEDSLLINYVNEKLVRFHQKHGPVNAVSSVQASVEELAQLYADAKIYMTCSEHEGFCVPAIEAMAFGVPIIATNGSALPETCGDAALLAKTPKEFTEALLTLAADDRLRENLGRIGRERYQRLFTNHAITVQWIDFMHVNSGLFSPPPPFVPLAEIDRRASRALHAGGPSEEEV